MSKIEVVDLKECGGDTEKISIFLNKIKSQRRTYDFKSVSLTDDRNTAVMIFENAEGMGYFNMLSAAANERKNENLPASAGQTFNDAIAVLLNHARGVVRVFIPEKTRNEFDRWFHVFKNTFPVYLESERIKMVEIISFHPDEKLLRDLKKRYSNKIKIFNLVLKKQQDVPGFMVIEPIGCWMEVLGKEIMIRGIANFGDAEGTQKLIECFDKKLKSAAVPFLV